MNYRHEPFMQYRGGKRRLLIQYENLYPKQLIDWDDFVYIEPFVGGGSVFLYIMQNFKKVKRAIINDKNTDVIDVYKAIKYNPQEIINQGLTIQKEYNSLPLVQQSSYYNEIRKELNNCERGIRRSICFLFTMFASFNALIRVNKSGLYNQTFGKKHRIDFIRPGNIKGISRMLQKTEILNGDYSEVLKYVDDRTFMFLDPPYKPTGQRKEELYNKDNFNDEEQIRLKQFCDTLTQKNVLFMQSNSNDQFFYDLYKDYTIDKVYINRLISQKKKTRGLEYEIVIRNYDKTMQKKLFDL